MQLLPTFKRKKKTKNIIFVYNYKGQKAKNLEDQCQAY